MKASIQVYFRTFILSLLCPEFKDYSWGRSVQKIFCIPLGAEVYRGGQCWATTRHITCERTMRRAGEGRALKRKAPFPSERADCYPSCLSKSFGIVKILFQLEIKRFLKEQHGVLPYGLTRHFKLGDCVILLFKF